MTNRQWVDSAAWRVAAALYVVAVVIILVLN